MTIEEAKIYLSIQVELKHRLGKEFEAKCLQLGLEALARLDKYRQDGEEMRFTLLPSESK